MVVVLEDQYVTTDVRRSLHQLVQVVTGPHPVLTVSCVQLTDYFCVVLCTQVGKTPLPQAGHSCVQDKSFLEVFLKELRTTYPGMIFLASQTCTREPPAGSSQGARILFYSGRFLSLTQPAPLHAIICNF